MERGPRPRPASPLRVVISELVSELTLAAVVVLAAEAPPRLLSSAAAVAREGGVVVAGAEVVAGAARGGAHPVWHQPLLLQSSRRL